MLQSYNPGGKLPMVGRAIYIFHTVYWKIVEVK